MEFILSILELFGIYVMVTISLNYLVGNVGVLYLGHIASFAIGAYASAICPVILDTSPILSLAIGVFINLILAFAIGKAFIQLSGHYLLVASLGITEIVRSIINNSTVTGGAQGITIVNSFLGSGFFAAKYEILILVGGGLFLEMLFFKRLKSSPKGRLFEGLREDTVLIKVMGNNPARLKIQALMITSAWISIAGSLFAHYSLYIDPTSFTINESLLIYIGILIGGKASMKGSIFAAFILIIIPILLRFVQLPSSLISAGHQVFFAMSVLFILKFYPSGIFKKSIWP